MRRTLTKKNSTRAERRFAEILKELRIPFEHRVIIEGAEVDFLLPKNVCVEINGHPQSELKNSKLLESGYSLFHYENAQIPQEREQIKKTLSSLCLNQM